MSNEDVIARFRAQYSFPLDAFQIEAAESLLDGRSVLVTAPTGSGKTIVAEFAIFDALDRQLQVIYTTPLKALSNQKYRDLLTQYPENRVGLVTGDLSINPQADVVVMTTEILRNILYQNPRRMDSVLYVVIDECHYMNDVDRGTVWEEIIIHAPSHLCLVGLSATIANADELANWISSIHNEMRVIEHLERPVPLRYFYIHEDKLLPVYNSKGKMNQKLEKLAERLREEKKQLQKNRRHTKRQRGEGTPEGRVVEALREQNMLPAIYFIFSRRNCDDTLSNCLDAGMDLTNEAEKKAIKAEIERLLQEYPSLTETGPSTENLLTGLPFGLAAHHAGLVPILRHLVELLFQRNLVKVVFATETLAAGINMPARTTVISSLSKRTDVGHRSLTVNEFTQMTGRAGRRGMDKEGFCVIVGGYYQTPHQALDLIQGDFDPISSHFSLSYNMVLNLLRHAERREVRQVLQRSFGQYLSNKEMINLNLQMEKKRHALDQLKRSAESKSIGRHLRSQIRVLSKQLKRQQEIYLKEFDALTRVLQYFGRIKPDNAHWRITPMGEATGHIRAQNDLLISLVIESLDYTAFSPVEIAAIFSTLVFEPRRQMQHDLSACPRKVRNFFRDILAIADDLRFVQEEENIHMPITVEFDFAPLVMLWGTGAKWATLFKFTEMTDGDVVRSMRQLIDLLRQLETQPHIPDDLRKKVREALPLIDRDLIRLVM
ncbi:MAG: DEAD/DEAH box helicase [Candidatus Sericytochromatia bacterium]